MPASNMPEHIVDRFRTLAAERLARIEALWLTLLQEPDNAEASAEIGRLVHTVKGDARMVGFADVNLLCQKIEDMLAVAADLEYRVPEDLDMVVGMAVQLTEMLAQKRVGAPIGGIDLAAFAGQVDEIVANARRGELRTEMDRPLPSAPRTTMRSAIAGDRRAGLGGRLADAATTAYIEYLCASGGSIGRLRGLWESLRREVERIEATPIDDVIERHAASARALAADLGKKVAVRSEGAAVPIGDRAANALDIALLHVVRNAVDHGVESPDDRCRAGKPPEATVTIAARIADDHVIVTVDDDGAGIDAAKIRQRAVAAGLVEPGASLSDTEVRDLIFRSGFSSRTSADTTSGRGVGLDAARTALQRSGGTIAIFDRNEPGACIALRVPLTVRAVRVHAFSAVLGLPLAISAAWIVEVAPPGSGDAADPLESLSIRVPNATAADPSNVLIARNKGLCARYLVGSQPSSRVAYRLCPTPAESPVEVVSLDGVEALLLRPERLPARARARTSGSETDR